jgi:hypothetical protein
VRCRIGQGCEPPSSGDFGQNQPVKVMNTGIAPIGTAHGVKIDPMKRPAVASAVSNGHSDGSGKTTL